MIDLLNDFYDNKVDLWRINKAHITLLQKKKKKKKGATRIEDFQPISMLSTIPKIITKHLAERLRLFLPRLVLPHQTAFINERCITETFILARQSLSFLHTHKIPCLNSKLTSRRHLIAYPGTIYSKYCREEDSRIDESHGYTIS
jgi:hypothetical protein